MAEIPVVDILVGLILLSIVGGVLGLGYRAVNGGK